MAELSKKPKFKTEPVSAIQTKRKISETDVSNYSEYGQTKCHIYFQEADLEYPSLFSDRNKVILLAFLVFGAAVALPKMISLPMAGNSGSGRHCSA